MRIIGAVNAYQDAALLARCLPALRRVVDLLIVVDGVYAGFPAYDARPYSTDGTLDVAADLADVVVLPPFGASGLRAPWPTEIAKRCAYLMGQRDDYYLVVDADEVVEVLDADGRVNPSGRVDVAELVERDDWLVMLARDADATDPYPIHRLFRHRDGIRYHGAHHAVHLGEHIVHPRGLEREAPDSVFPRLRLRHLWNQRDADRVERKGVYYREILTPSEREFRAANGLGR